MLTSAAGCDNCLITTHSQLRVGLRAEEVKHAKSFLFTIFSTVHHG